MDYAEYKKIIDSTPETKGLEYDRNYCRVYHGKAFYVRQDNNGKACYVRTSVWDQPNALPVSLISLNGCEKKIIKVPSETVNRFENTVSVIEIRSDAFRNNKNLTDIILGHDIEQIGGGAFEGCTSLERITIPRKINCIWQGTFKDCISLSDIYYEGTPEEWEKIEKFTEKKEVELGKLIPGSPVQKVFEKITPIEGNEALIRATVHFNCDLF